MGRGRKGERKESKRKKERKASGFITLSASGGKTQSVGRAWRYLEDECLQNLLEGWSEGGG